MNLSVKPGILSVIAQFVCIGVSSNVLCLAFLKQHTPGLICPIGKGELNWGCGLVVVEHSPGRREALRVLLSTTRCRTRVEQSRALNSCESETLCAEPVETQVSTSVFCVGLSPTSRRIAGQRPSALSCVKIEFISQGPMHGLLCCSSYS